MKRADRRREESRGDDLQVLCARPESAIASFGSLSLTWAGWPARARHRGGRRARCRGGWPSRLAASGRRARALRQEPEPTPKFKPSPAIQSPARCSSQIEFALMANLSISTSSGAAELKSRAGLGASRTGFSSAARDRSVSCLGSGEAIRGAEGEVIRDPEKHDM